MLINSFKFAQYSKRYLETIPKLKRIKRVPDTLDNRKNIWMFSWDRQTTNTNFLNLMVTDLKNGCSWKYILKSL